MNQKHMCSCSANSIYRMARNFRGTKFCSFHEFVSDHENFNHVNQNLNHKRSCCHGVSEGMGVMGMCGPFRLAVKQAWYHHAPLYDTAQFSPLKMSLPMIKGTKQCTAMASNNQRYIYIVIRHFWSIPGTI